ncbi:hypothetical protein [Chitinophaga caseinilytica]|uniref:YD repeat-containing protein n=1 Tax=Chitinophaga caseinilytica TaxID=2267521 RepID=A0ABZ2Z8F4_9BACT
MKIRSIPFLLASLCLFMPLFTHAQETLGQPKFDYSPKTPEIAAMQQFQDFPVSYFTGIPNITIPLLKVPSKSGSVNFSLTYQGGGVKADQQTGVVGLGWSLNAGGMITRTVKGNPDEGIRFRTVKDTSIVFNPGTGKWDTTYFWGAASERWMLSGYQIYGGMYTDNSSNLDLTAVYSRLVSNNNSVKSGSAPDTWDLENYYAGMSDGEPDMFYFNFEGYSGKFYFKNKQPVLIPQNQELKIVTTFYKGVGEYSMTDNYFDAFSIITPDGKEYRFGGSTSARVLAEINNSGYYKPNAWLLTTIIDRNSKDTIRFEYEQRSSSLKRPVNGQEFVKATDFDACIDLWGSLQTERFKEARLLKVTTRKAEARLYYSDVSETYVSTSRLDSIRLYDRVTGLPDKKSQLDYSNFKSGRLKLNACILTDVNARLVMPYQFTYYDTAFQKDPVNTTKDFYSPYSQDYWGFYNDKVINHQKQSLYILCGTTGNRKPAWPQMQRDALIAVSYPTGGKTMLEYEPHDFSSARNLDGTFADADNFQSAIIHDFNISSMVGGLRLKRMLHYDPLRGDTLIRKLTYRKFDLPNQSSGHLYVSPSLFVSLNTPYCSPSDPARYFVATHNIQENSNGEGHIGYNNVAVTEEKAGVSNGRTEYEYFSDVNTDSTFYFNVCDSAVNNCYIGNYDILVPWLPKRVLPNLLTGMEKAKRVYTQAGQILQESRTNYQSIRYSGMLRAILLRNVEKNKLCGIPPINGGTTPSPNGSKQLLSPNFSFQFLQSYVIGRMAIMPKETIEDHYTTSGLKMTDTITFTYASPYHILPTRKTSRSSNGLQVYEDILYAADFTDVAGDSTFKYLKKGYYNFPIASFKNVNGKVVSGGYRKYKMSFATDSTSILPKEEYALLTVEGELPTAINLTTTYPKQLNFTASKFLRVADYEFDTDNNISQVTTKGGGLRALTWDYNNSQPVSATLNAGRLEIAYTSFESATNGRWTGSSSRVAGGIMGSRAYSLSAGALSVSGLPSGKEYIVSYWSNGAAAAVNGIAATQGPLKQGWRYYQHILPATTTSVSVSGTVQIDELRLYPRQASMSTFAYNPLSGVTEIATPNGISQFEYDGLDRLLLIRDLDGNIIKQAAYVYETFNHTAATWLNTGTTRCKPCAANSAYNDVILQHEQTDINPRSATFSTKRWVDAGTSTSCTSNAVWQNTATATRCKKNGSNQNTGEIEQEQKDMNPCSATYNTLRWVVTGTNLTTCPLPVVCSGNDKKLINGVCETGNRVNTASAGVIVNGQNRYKCTYHYEWSDCSKSINYEEIMVSPCTLNLSCDDW